MDDIFDNSSFVRFLISCLGSQASKPLKGKPTLSVAPQIKQPFYSDKTINFVEMNKMTTSAQKQPNQTSYKSKFIDRHKKDSPKPVLKKSASLNDSLQYPKASGEKVMLISIGAIFNII